MIKNKKKLTYISLFSSAGVGCYGFKKAGFECIATNELIERRLNIQKYNSKCFLDSGYINGDITKETTKNCIYEEIKKWEKLGNDKVDVVIATPPCQGMSVANHKKNKDEIIRNSLVVESICLIKEINPRFFIFENVSAFMKTGCTTKDGKIEEIGKVIDNELGEKYIITSRILNFKNYGSNSSRTRTVVIGVEKNMGEYIAPIELYPSFQKEKTLKQTIGHLPGLEWGEFCDTDYYHQFRTYPEHMRSWIHDLKEGEGAFSNSDISKRPHRIINGIFVQNKEKNGDKYTRQYWNKIAPCIHTRNDQLASQNTVHPTEDRVFSIRELMCMMTIPSDFKWSSMSMEQLNEFPLIKKRKLLKKEEMNIRQSIGEAVPTNIFYQIALNISSVMENTNLSNKKIEEYILKYKLFDFETIRSFIKNNPMNLGYSTLSRIVELTNIKRKDNAAYFTNKFIINEICGQLPDTQLDEINILEPSVGIGNFLPLVMRKYEDKKKVLIDIVDIDKDILELLKLLLTKIEIPVNVKIRFICDDFLLHKFEKKYFLVIGNPPFSKLKKNEVKEYVKNNFNKETTNLFEFFLEKAISLGDHVAMITPKSLLNTPEFVSTRLLIEKYRVNCILDFGEQGFKGVLIETICMLIDTLSPPSKTIIKSTSLNKQLNQLQKYIFAKDLPYWVIYRDTFFDKVYSKMEFGIFKVFRDRQITNSNTSFNKTVNSLRVIKARNIMQDGSKILSIPGYDAYIEKELAKSLSVYKYVNNMDLYLTPNMTYKPRVIKNVADIIVNGSVAILIPINNISLTKKQLSYFATDEYRKFYQIARNYQTRSLNIDKTSVYWFGRLKG
ncbi:MAG: DNA cytosine methyltransferase [Sphaerochaeta sp.]